MSVKDSDERGQKIAMEPDSSPTSKAEPSPEWWHRPIVWITTIITALVVAIATAFGSGIGERLFSLVAGVNSRHASDQVTQNPVEIESASYVWSDSAVFAFPGVLTKEQVSALTRAPGLYPDGVPKNPESFDQYMTRVAAYGGASVAGALMQVVLRGNSPQPVVITGMQVIKQCRPPLTGTLLYSPSAGEMNNIAIGFDLDQEFSLAQFWNSRSGKFYGNYFANKTIVLNQGEISTLAIEVQATRKSCSFNFILMVDYGNRQIEETINHHGQPFVTTPATYPAGSQFPPPVPFSDFKEIYAGGVSLTNSNGPYLKVNPRTFNGAGP